MLWSWSRSCPRGPGPKAHGVGGGGAGITGRDAPRATGKGQSTGRLFRVGAEARRGHQGPRAPRARPPPAVAPPGGRGPGASGRRDRMAASAPPPPTLLLLRCPKGPHGQDTGQRTLLGRKDPPSCPPPTPGATQPPGRPCWSEGPGHRPHSRSGLTLGAAVGWPAAPPAPTLGSRCSRGSPRPAMQPLPPSRARRATRRPAGTAHRSGPGPGQAAAPARSPTTTSQGLSGPVQARTEWRPRDPAHCHPGAARYPSRGLLRTGLSNTATRPEPGFLKALRLTCAPQVPPGCQRREQPPQPRLSSRPQECAAMAHGIPWGLAWVSGEGLLPQKNKAWTSNVFSGPLASSRPTPH